MSIDYDTRTKTIEEYLRSLRPKNSLEEYYHLAHGAGLFPQFAAVLAGLRPGMDCWIPFDNLEKFTSFVHGQGLSLTVDSAFRDLPVHERDRVVGAETLCTTHAIGIPLDDALPSDQAHCFVGASEDIVRRMRASGAYPLAVKGRISNKPFVDHLDYGKWLGYPDCCIDFFKHSNNWNRTNSYAEAYMKTLTKFDYRTNCFGKNLGYSLSFHLPCSFDCEATIGFSERLLEFLKRVEPEYASACRELLLKPVLSLNEREIVVLDGEFMGTDRVKFRGVINLFSTPSDVLTALEQGDIVELRNRFVLVFRGSELIDIFECRCDVFGPRVPLLIHWS